MKYNPFSLEERVILITGASSGIGKATAIECSRMGATVVITARNKSRLEETFNSLEGEGHSMIIADLKQENDINCIIKQSPLLDGIVHCAGLVTTQLFQFISRKELTQIMEVNFTSPVIMTQMLLEQKKIKKESSIVFISSVMGTHVSSIGNSMYSSTKSAIEGMVKGMALDLSGKKIRVNCICPGMVDTGFIANGAIAEEQLQKDAKENYPLKRYGKPEEIAYATIYLLSGASNWITGSSLLIDGGFTLK
jgi:Dehydrogenases with different specificities (related to short-chain alcohol dehydrogenases)